MTNTTSAPASHIGHGCPDDPTWDPETQTWSTLPAVGEMATAELITCTADGCRMQFFLVAGRDLPTLCMDHADIARISR